MSRHHKRRLLNDLSPNTETHTKHSWIFSENLFICELSWQHSHSTQLRGATLKCPISQLFCNLSRLLNLRFLIVLLFLFCCQILSNKTMVVYDIMPVGVVLLPRRSGTLSSSLCMRQQIRNHYSYRPRIPRAQHLSGLSHILLRFVALDVNSFWRHFPCRLCRQLQQELGTLCHLR